MHKLMPILAVWREYVKSKPESMCQNRFRYVTFGILCHNATRKPITIFHRVSIIWDFMVEDYF